MIDERRQTKPDYLYEDKMPGGSLSVANQTGISPSEGSGSEFLLPDKFRLYLKNVLFYLPGTFMLLHYGMGVTYDLINGGQLIQSPSIPLFIIVSALMCVSGLGDPKNLKSLLIPTAIFGVGSVMGIANVVTNLLTGAPLVYTRDRLVLVILAVCLNGGCTGEILG